MAPRIARTLFCGACVLGSFMLLYTMHAVFIAGDAAEATEHAAFHVNDYPPMKVRVDQGPAPPRSTPPPLPLTPQLDERPEDMSAGGETKLTFWERVQRGLGELVFGYKESETIAVAPPLVEPATEWDLIDWTPRYPNGMSASDFEVFKREVHNSNLTLMQPLPTEKSIWGAVYGPEYNGNTKEQLRVMIHNGVPLFVKAQSPVKTVLQAIELVEPMMRLINECGFHKIVPQHWVSLASGYPAVYSEYVHGITFDAMKAAKYPPLSTRWTNLRKFLQAVHPWQIRLMAIFDVLFSYADRHAGNILVTDNFDLIAIDCFQGALAGRIPFVDSIMVPITEVYAIHRLGWHTLFTDRTGPTGMPDDPTLLLDYRCASRSGRIGFDYPPIVESCMQRFAASTADELREQYGLPLSSAAWLSAQSRRMLTLGFEETCRVVAEEQIRSQGGTNIKVGDKRMLFYSFEPCCAIVRDECKLRRPEIPQRNSSRPGRLDW